MRGYRGLNHSTDRLRARVYSGFVRPFAVKLNAWISFVNSNPQMIQAMALEKCLGVVRGSLFERKYNALGDRLSVERFKETFPICTYQDIEPIINRAILSGRLDELFSSNTKIRMCALSSGTTGSRKLIPITHANERAFGRAWFRWGVSLYHDYPQILTSPVLHLASSWKQKAVGVNKISCGDLSGFLVDTQPWYVKSFYRTPGWLMEIMDQQKKFYLFLRLTIASEDIQFISTATPATLVSLADFGEKWQESIIRDIFDGTISNKFEWTPKEKENFRRLRLKKNKKRSVHLDGLSGTSEKFWPRVYWPHLRLIATWTGGTFSHYSTGIADRYGPVNQRDIGYLASEGMFALPFFEESHSGFPMLDDYFFEFIPFGEPIESHSKTLNLNQIEPGKFYQMIISNQGGLIRYRMNDIIRCDNYRGAIPQISFAFKDHFFCDLSGEKLSAYHVSMALNTLSESIRVDLSRSFLIPRRDIPVGYLLYLEEDIFEKVLRIQDFENRLDEELKVQNFIYREHRDADKLGRVGVASLRTGAFDRFRCFRLKLNGGSSEQFKYPNLLSARADIEFIEGEI